MLEFIKEIISLLGFIPFMLWGGIKTGVEWSKDKLNLQELNLILNGGFDDDDGRSSIAAIADEATTMFHEWIFDKAGTSAPVCTVRTETTNKKTNSKQACEIEITTLGSGSPTCGVKQTIDNFEELRGLKISLRIPGYCSTANKMRAYIDDGVAKTYSSYHSGGASFEDLDVENYTVDNAATKLEIGIEYIADATTTFYVDNAMLVPGDTSVDYTPFCKATKNYVDNLNFHARYGYGDDSTDRSTSSDTYEEESNCSCSIVVKENDLVEIELLGVFYVLTATNGLWARVYLSSGSASVLGNNTFVRSRTQLADAESLSCKSLYRATADGTLVFTMYWKREGASVGHALQRKIIAKVIGKYVA